VVGEAATGDQAVELARTLAPDVVLMDLRMPVLGGVEATRQVHALPAPPRVVALTTFDDDETVFDAIRAGALGYLLKDARAAPLVEAIELAARGESFLPPAIAAKLVGEFARLPAPGRPGVAASLGLSDRELVVLRKLGVGAANKEIAAELGIAEGTVKNHVTSILDKLGVDGRTQAALKARALGLL
jgi:DNA-binding NarL/FixJ family response regulator